MEEGLNGRQLYRSLLLRMKGGPNVPVAGRRLVLEDVFNLILELVTAEALRTCQVFHLVQVASRATCVQYTGKNKIWVIKNLTHLGLVTMELVSRCVNHDSTITLTWERVAFLAASLVRYWRPEMYKKQPLMLSPFLKFWLSMAMCRPDTCPNPAIRLELLRFVAMWDLQSLVDVEVGSAIMFGVTYNAVNLTVNDLLPRGRVGLLWPLRKVLHDLHIASFLAPIMRRSCAYIQEMVVGHVERSVAKLVVLMGKTSRRVLQLQRIGDLTPLGTEQHFLNILHILRLLVATPPNQELFEQPGMCQIAATAIAKTCRSIMEISDAPETKQHFARLVRKVDNFFWAIYIFRKTDTLVKELQLYHSRSLSYIAAKMKQLGCSAYAVPDPLEEETQTAPERFLDSKTGRLMEWPVKLLLSGQVVDLTTLLLLKLATAADPRTGVMMRNLNYESMPSLEEEIHLWKLQQHHI